MLAVVAGVLFAPAGARANPTRLTGRSALVAQSASARPEFRSGSILVGFRPGIGTARQRRLERLVGVRWKRTLGIASRAWVATRAGRRLERRLGAEYALGIGGRSVLWAVRVLRRQRRFVRFAEPDYVLQASGVRTRDERSFVRTPDDPSFGLQWGSLNMGQTVNGVSGTAGADDRAARAWAVSAGSRSIVIGEVDTGVDYTHPDLAANVWSNPGGVGGCPAGTHGYNVVDSTCDPMDTDVSYNGHGTHVAGIMGAVGNNSTGVAGMNWSTTILPVRWVSDDNGANTTSQLIFALNWLLQAKQAGVNVRVINDSTVFIGSASSQALSDEISLLGANNILFVTAAGNTDQDNDNPATPRYPCNYDLANEICVTASNQRDRLPSYANYGPATVDMAAPGDNIYSTLRNHSYGYISGSSMAAAQVSGAGALILSVTPSMTAISLKADILDTVDRLRSLAGKVRTGGRLDVCKAIRGCESRTQAATARVELQTCTTHARCRTRMARGSVWVTATASEWASLTRRGRRYASGETRVVARRHVVLLVARHGLPLGRYTLTLRSRAQRTGNRVIRTAIEIRRRSVRVA